MPCSSRATVEPRRNLAEKSIADRMAERVVDGLELVQVEPKECRDPLAIGRFGQCLRKAFAKVGAIGEPGQGVGMRHVAQLSLGKLPLLGLSPDHGHRQGHREQDQKCKAGHECHERLAVTLGLRGLVQIDFGGEVDALSLSTGRMIRP